MVNLTAKARELRAKFDAAPPVPRALLAPYILPLLELIEEISTRLDERENDGANPPR